MKRLVLLFIICALLATCVQAKDLGKKQQKTQKQLEQMSERELLEALKNIDDMGRNLEAVTLTAQNMLNDAINHFRAKLALLVSDNNNIMSKLKSERKVILELLKKAKAKGKKNK